MIWQNTLLYIEKEESEIPWLKIFVQRKVKELSDCTTQERTQLFDCMLSIEKCMLEYYQPEKVNIASFGNMLPQVHMHVMARFTGDSYFPHPMWGEKQREHSLILPPWEEFETTLLKSLHTL